MLAEANVLLEKIVMMLLLANAMLPEMSALPLATKTMSISSAAFLAARRVLRKTRLGKMKLE